jgi:D-alanyl-D-alanine carboxypeptidase
MGIEHSAAAAIVIEPGRGMELYAKEADKPTYIPGLSKVMTAILVLQRFPADTYVTVSLLAEETNANAVPQSQLSDFTAGDKYTVEYLVASMFYIDSDAASIALAELHSGSESAFTKIMNERAGQLDLFDTVFLNSTGRAVSQPDDPDGETDTQYPVSTPRDAAKLVRYFLQNDNYARTVNTAFRISSTRFFPTTDARSIEITNNLAYAWTYVDYLTGLFASDDSGTISLIDMRQADLKPSPSWSGWRPARRSPISKP